MLWVNVYLVDKAYGGPEEGGWWYTFGVCEHAVPCETPELAKSVETALQGWCDAKNGDRKSDIGSVLSEGRYDVWTEEAKGENWPNERPHYE